MAHKVAVVMGSDSDWLTMEQCVLLLREWGIDCDVEIMSAHRTPGRVHEFARQAAENGYGAIIAAAGLSAALAGSIAAATTLPVIGVPVASGPLQGIDALLSTVQMPPGVPVATMGIGPMGARNAACLAAQILGLSDRRVADKLRAYKKEQAASVEAKNKVLRERLSGE
jgi:phosphoribosylaminoimidazole carboxylase PurE protein